MEDKARHPPNSAKNKVDGRKWGGWSVQRTGIRQVARRARVNRQDVVKEVVDGFDMVFGYVCVSLSMGTFGGSTLS